MKVFTLQDILIQCRGNQSAASTLLGINRGTLRRYINEGVELLITQNVDGTYKPYIAIQDRKNGAHKK